MAAAATTTTTPRRPFIFLFFFLHFWSRSLRCELFELRLIQKMFLLLLFLFCDSHLSSSTSGLHHHAGAFARIFHGPFHLCFFFVFLYFSSRFFLCRVWVNQKGWVGWEEPIGKMQQLNKKKTTTTTTTTNWAHCELWIQSHQNKTEQVFLFCFTKWKKEEKKKGNRSAVVFFFFFLLLLLLLLVMIASSRLVGRRRRGWEKKGEAHAKLHLPNHIHHFFGDYSSHRLKHFSLHSGRRRCRRRRQRQRRRQRLGPGNHTSLALLVGISALSCSIPVPPLCLLLCMFLTLLVVLLLLLLLLLLFTEA